MTNGVINESTKVPLKLVISILVLVVSLFMAAASFKADLAKKMDVAAANQTFVTCDRYNADMEALQHRLERIETKLDHLIEREALR